MAIFTTHLSGSVSTELTGSLLFSGSSAGGWTDNQVQITGSVGIKNALAVGTDVTVGNSIKLGLYPTVLRAAPAGARLFVDGDIVANGGNLSIGGGGAAGGTISDGAGNVQITFDEVSVSTTIANDLFVNDYARIDALRVGVTSTDPGDGVLHVEGSIETPEIKSPTGNDAISIANDGTMEFAKGISSSPAVFVGYAGAVDNGAEWFKIASLPTPTATSSSHATFLVNPVTWDGVQGPRGSSTFIIDVKVLNNSTPTLIDYESYITVERSRADKKQITTWNAAADVAINYSAGMTVCDLWFRVNSGDASGPVTNLYVTPLGGTGVEAGDFNGPAWKINTSQTPSTSLPGTNSFIYGEYANKIVGVMTGSNLQISGSNPDVSFLSATTSEEAGIRFLDSGVFGISGSGDVTVTHGSNDGVIIGGEAAILDIKSDTMGGTVPKLKFSRPSQPSWDIVGAGETGDQHSSQLRVSYDAAYGHNAMTMLVLSGSGQLQLGQADHDGVLKLADNGKIVDAAGVTKLSIKPAGETSIGAGSMMSAITIQPDGSRETMYGWNSTTCKRINKYNQFSSGSITGGSANNHYIKIAEFGFSDDMDLWNRTFEASYIVTITGGGANAWKPLTAETNDDTKLAPWYQIPAGGPYPTGTAAAQEGGYNIPKFMEAGMTGVGGIGPTPHSWLNGPSTKAWPWYRDAAWGVGGAGMANPVGMNGNQTAGTSGTLFNKGWEDSHVNPNGMWPRGTAFSPMTLIGRQVTDKLDDAQRKMTITVPPGGWSNAMSRAGSTGFSLSYQVDVSYTPRAMQFRGKEIPVGSGNFFDEYVPLPVAVSCQVKLLSDSKFAPQQTKGAFTTWEEQNFAFLQFTDPCIPTGQANGGWGPAGTNSSLPSPWLYDAGTGRSCDNAGNPLAVPLVLKVFVNAGIAGANCYVTAVKGANQADGANTSEGQGHLQLAPIYVLQGDQNWISHNDIFNTPFQAGTGPVRAMQASAKNEYLGGQLTIGGPSVAMPSISLSETALKTSAAAGVIGVTLECTSEMNLVSKAATPIYRMGENGGAHLPPTGGSLPVLAIDGNGKLARFSSTRKIKKDIVNSDIGLNEILELKPKTYKFKSTSVEELGLIAEDAASVSSLFTIFGIDRTYDENGQELCIETDQGTVPALDSDELVPIDLNNRALIAALINSVQDLKKENDQLKLRIEALEAE